MGAPPKSSDPVIDPHDLPNYDGFLFGIPTRFGMMPAQMKAVFDATGGLWQKGSLIGKPAGMFVSTSTQGGGQVTGCCMEIRLVVAFFFSPNVNHPCQMQYAGNHRIDNHIAACPSRLYFCQLGISSSYRPKDFQQ
jgi:multimeric flavodoxin WrbA